MTQAGRTLGQTLRAAREGKGWDIARAERDTRIRARYLIALEAGDYRDLPSSVYTSGFVRNYARYLGLNPEWCLDLYRMEANPAQKAAPVMVDPTAKTVEAKGGAVVTTSRLVKTGLLLLVAALVVYLGYQFLTFAGTPELTLTDPASDLAAYSGTSYVLRGETVPDAQITVDGLRENPTATASASGVFAIRVELLPGSNVITLVATDPLTGRESSPVRRTITVSLDAATPLPGGAPNLTSPEADAVISGGVTVAGTVAPGASVTVRAALIGAPIPSFEILEPGRPAGGRPAVEPHRARAGIGQLPTWRGSSACRSRWGSAPGSCACQPPAPFPAPRPAPHHRSRPSDASPWSPRPACPARWRSATRRPTWSWTRTACHGPGCRPPNRMRAPGSR